MIDVTIIILTKNEEINLPDCLESVKGFAKRCVVVDSFSTDKTKEIAQRYGADFYEHKFENYARQFNWGLDNTNITTKWTFRLDADERLTLELKEELSTLAEKYKDDDNVNGFTMEAWLYFLGKQLKHGPAQKRKLMMFKTGIGRIEDIKMDEHTLLSHGTSVSCKNKFIHYDFKSIHFFMEKMNWYATREMQDYFQHKNGRDYSIEGDKEVSSTRNKKYGIYYKFPKFIRCWLIFIYEYFFLLSFLDGMPGLVQCVLYDICYRSIVDAKILEQELFPKPFEETGALK